MNMKTAALVQAARSAPGARTSKTLSSRIDLNELMNGCRRMVIVATHPGDETLRMGGAAAMWLQQGGTLAVIAVTDGDAATTTPGCWWTPARLRCLRPTESTLALRHLGWPQTSAIKRLHVPDGKVADHEPLLTSYLQRWLRSDDCILTAWEHDGPSDYAATSRAVATAATSIGCAVAEFPIWNRNRVLIDATGTARHARELELGTEALWRKRKALTTYRSQLDADPNNGIPPAWSDHLLASCLQAFEVLLFQPRSK